MKPGPGRRWLVGAVGLFLFLFVLWILAVFQLSPASAGAGALQLRLRSNLAADYTAAPVMRMLRTLRLTVMEDVMRDMGMSDEEASAEMRAMAELLESPVPTATARGLMGEAPLTPTATKTPVPTDTPVPTATATRRPPPTATETDEPTRRPRTRTPTAEPGGEDEAGPSIDLSGADWGPPPGDLPGCSVTFTMEGVRVTDSAPSSGIDYVGFKYRVDGFTDLILGPPFELDSGGASGDGWDGVYSGEVEVEIDPEWCSTCEFEIELWVKSYDVAGNETVHSLGEYTMSEDCGGED